MNTKTYTITAFAKKIGVARTTVWRWATKKKFKKYLKMYDAVPKKMEGDKYFIEQTLLKK